MLYHAVAQWRLNELGLLARLLRVSSVSGGSITAGLLATRWATLRFDPVTGLASDFVEQVVAPIRKFAGKNIDIPSGIREERRERPLLLHPYFDDPAEHLEFVWGVGPVDDGHIRARRNGSGRESVRGRTTIDVCALQRLGLVRARQRRLVTLIAFLEIVVERKADVDRAPGSRAARKRFEQSVQDVQRIFKDVDPQYLSMTEQVIEAYFKRIFGL
jgi:hypothetical protein